MLAATLMPDHLHMLVQLGCQLKLGQMIAKYKTLTRPALSGAGLVWQDNFHDHRLRADEMSGAFAKYIFLNPYRKGLLRVREEWPWWVCHREFRPDFFEILAEGRFPHAEWLATGDSIDALVERDFAEAEEAADGDCA